jgi:hypothetical protein
MVAVADLAVKMSMSILQRINVNQNLVTMKLYHKKRLFDDEESQDEVSKENFSVRPGADYIINQLTIWVVIAFLFVLLAKRFLI